VPRPPTPPPSGGDPEAECEALADNYAAAHNFYETGTAASITAWNSYINAHNASRSDNEGISRLRQSYDRLSANLDRSLAAMAASEQAARAFPALHQGRCDLDQITGKRFRGLPPPKG